MAKSSSIDPFQLDRCPITGLPITRKPGWTNLALAQGYSASFCLIGDRILASTARGNSGRAGIPRFFEERERVLREMGLWEQPHLEIKDYGAIDPNHPRHGRSQFSNALAAEGRRGMLRGFWGYNGPTAFRWIMQVALELVGYDGPVPVRLVKDYRAAILEATAARSRLEGVLSERTTRRPEWTLELGGYRFHFEVIDHDVVYAEIPGELPVEHVDRFFELYEQVLGEPGLFPDGTHRLIVLLKDFRGGTWRGRQTYLKKMRCFRRRHPCKHVVALGTTRMFNVVIRINRHLIPYRLDPAASLQQALEVIERQRERPTRPRLVELIGRIRPRDARRRSWTEEQIKQHTDEILQLLGSINWEIEGIEGFDPDRISADNPLGILLEAISLIKKDFDLMLRERAEMQAHVIRAAKLASLGTLTAGLAHELNNPLTAVLGFAQRLQRVPDSETRESAAAVVRAGRRMQSIVDKLVQADRAPVTAERTQVDINRQVEEALLLFEQQLDSQGIAVKLKLQEDLPPVRGNADHLEGVVQNLVTNARDALEEVEGQRSKRITITTSQSGRWVKLTLGDNGCGMPAEVAERAFDPFFTTKAVGKGAGLGLYVSHKIIDQYDGSMTLRSRPGRGTVVEVLLPAFCETNVG
jgi:signal transduction histidine kinase